MAFVRNAAGQVVLGELRGSEFSFQRLPLGRYTIVSGAPGVDESGAEQVTLDRDGDTRRVLLRAAVTVELQGRVVDDEDQPVVDAWVRASPAEAGLEAGAPLPAVLTDDQGMFVLTGLSRAPYDLAVSSPQGEAVVRGVRAGDAVAVVRVARYGSLAVEARTPGGVEAPLFHILYDSERGNNGRVDGRNGHGRVPWLAPDAYTVTITSEGTRAVEHVEILPGQATALNVTLAHE